VRTSFYKALRLSTSGISDDFHILAYPKPWEKLQSTARHLRPIVQILILTIQAQVPDSPRFRSDLATKRLVAQMGKR